MPLLASYHVLSSQTRLGGLVTSLELALNLPLSGLLIFNRVLEGLPVDILCSFLNQLKGPQAPGHGFRGPLPPPPHPSVMEPCGIFATQPQLPHLMTTGHIFAWEEM